MADDEEKAAELPEKLLKLHAKLITNADVYVRVGGCNECGYEWGEHADSVASCRFRNSHYCEFPLFERYADELIDKGFFQPSRRAELIEGLRIVEEYYWHGRSIERELKHNPQTAKALRKEGHTALADALKPTPGGRPKHYGDKGLIWKMAELCDYLDADVRGWLAYDGEKGVEVPGRLQRIVSGLLKRIDPKRERMPSRKLYRNCPIRLKK